LVNPGVITDVHIRQWIDYSRTVVVGETQPVSVLLQLVLSVAMADMAAQNLNSTLLLPSTTHVISLADSHDRAAFTAVTQTKEEPMDVDGYDVASLDVSSFCLLLSLHRLHAVHGMRPVATC